jgi:hypothetical protein
LSICCRSFSSFKKEFSQDSLKLKTIILKKRETDGGERKRRGKRRRSDPDLKARR